MVKLWLLLFLKKHLFFAFILVALQELWIFREVPSGLKTKVKERLGFNAWPFYLNEKPYNQMSARPRCGNGVQERTTI